MCHEWPACVSPPGACTPRPFRPAQTHCPTVLAGDQGSYFCGNSAATASCCTIDQCCDTEDPDQANSCSGAVFNRKLLGVSLRRSLKTAVGFTYTCVCSNPSSENCDGKVTLCSFASDFTHTSRICTCPQHSMRAASHSSSDGDCTHCAHSGAAVQASPGP